MKNAILILGNGFDLFHGNKTSYKEFIESVKKNYNKNLWIRHFSDKIELQGWIDIEKEVKYIIDLNAKFDEKYDEIYFEAKIEYEFKNLISFLGYDTLNYYEYEKLNKNDKDYKKVLKSVDFFIIPTSCLSFENTKNDRIKKDFIEVKNLLKDYIAENSIINENYSKNNSIYETLKVYDNLITINFNYTNNLDFYNKNIHNIFMHGNVNEEIIFGHNMILSEEFAIFNKNVQSVASYTSYKIELDTIINSINFDKEIDFIILGHSFDENDHESIAYIYSALEKTYQIEVQKFKFFYYNSEFNSDKVQRIYNIRRFFFNSLSKAKNGMFKIDDDFGIYSYDRIEFNNNFEAIELK